ncbi:NADH:ubiquinone oxidoreductase, Na(+)-translocating, A subunit, partial [gut metagenome]
MERLYKTKKGLDLNLKGQAQQELSKANLSAEYALSPSDFHGVVPRIVVKEGDKVQVGSPLFVDKATERIKFVSPVSGVVKSIVRGDRRKVLHVVVSSDKELEYKDFGKKDIQKMNAEAVKEALLDAGLFAFIHQRPYDVTATPQDTPKAIFISTFSKMPLAADFSYVVKGREADFKAGIKALAKLAKVYVGICPEQINTPLMPIEDAEVSVFSGPNPSGN